MGQRFYAWLMAKSPLIISGASLLILLTAFGFEHIGKLPPCEMCWWQRYAHMAAIPLGVMAYVMDRPGRRDWAMVALLAMGLALLIGAAIAGYHVGIEQKWWSGNSACTAVALQGSLEDQIKDLFARPVIRCDEIPWSLFGLSMAGYNMILSLILGLWALIAALARRNQP